jgi:hypothetical protein
MLYTDAQPARIAANASAKTAGIHARIFDDRTQIFPLQAPALCRQPIMNGGAIGVTARAARKQG